MSSAFADEDRPVAHPRDSARCARSSRRCSRRSANASRSPPSGIGSQPTKSVSQAYGAPLQLGVLVQVVVDVPGLVADPRGRRAPRSTRSWNTMKLATRISSIRRSAWKRAGRARRPRPRSVRTRWPACADAGCTCSPRALEHARHRLLGEPVDLQRRGAARAARRRWPGRARVARGRSARRGRARAGARASAARRGTPARRAASRSTNSRISRLTAHRIAGQREVAAALDSDELAAGHPERRASPRAYGVIRSSSP